MDNPILTRAELEARRGAKWAYFGPDHLPSWVADMDFRAPEAVTEALARLVAESDFGYAIRGGTLLGPALGRAFAARMRDRFGWEVDPARVLACTDLVQGVFDTVQAFSAPGDEVVVQGPTYDPFREGIEDSGRVMVVDHMRYADRGWSVDLDGLRAALRDSPLLLFCHPHNPTGRAFTRDELLAIGEIAIEQDAVIASDEIWADFMLDSAQHIPFASVSPEIAERTVTMYSAGKSFGLAGLRCAVLHFGSAALQERFHATFPPRMLGGANIMGVEATTVAWESGHAWFEQVLDIIRTNRSRMEAFLEQYGDRLDAAYPTSTYLYWVDCGRLGLEEPPAEFFKREGGVVFTPGAEFGAAYAPFVRVNLATSPEIFDQILAQAAKALDNLSAAGPHG
ncbi:MalY/PatB family protein [Nocardioides sp. L-11A]|uniref:MalY/PatB family protein n=1 Tax=Nocardioides sp. L-11A TaxID=3043848 RepID=UPI002499D280|nr:aminotransferase class I/II-fold pyridoxal phosphate-dependent enzyme [Nocardioides sp. L-11A]